MRSELRYSRSQASVPELFERYGLNGKTVRKWRKRSTVEDARMGPGEVRSSVLSPEEEAMCVAFRRHTLLPLDDCLSALRASVPHLSRSARHRLFQRHDISRLPEMDGDTPKRSKFERSPIGLVHIDPGSRPGPALPSCARRRASSLFVAIDRTLKFAFVKLVPKAGKMAATQFLRELTEAIPYRIHTVLTDNVLCSERGTDLGIGSCSHR